MSKFDSGIVLLEQSIPILGRTAHVNGHGCFHNKIANQATANQGDKAEGVATNQRPATPTYARDG